MQVVVLLRAAVHDAVPALLHVAGVAVAVAVAVGIAVAAVAGRALVLLRVGIVHLKRLGQLGELVGGAVERPLPPLVRPVVLAHLLRAQALLVLPFLNLDGLGHALLVLAQALALRPAHLGHHRLSETAVRFLHHGGALLEVGYLHGVVVPRGRSATRSRFHGSLAPAFSSRASTLTSPPRCASPVAPPADFRSRKSGAAGSDRSAVTKSPNNKMTSCRMGILHEGNSLIDAWFHSRNVCELVRILQIFVIQALRKKRESRRFLDRRRRLEPRLLFRGDANLRARMR